jgi:phenylacetate-CoA ligase
MFTPKSAVPGILWPALASGSLKWRMFALLQQLGETQWLAPDTLRALQFRQLDRLLGYAYDEIPFYRHRLEAAGYRSDRPLTPEIWQNIPILTRSDIQSQGDALLSPKLPAQHGPPEKIVTSGSTGRPIEAYGTRVSGLFAAATTLRGHLWHRRDLSEKLAGIRHLRGPEALEPDGVSLEQWGAAEVLMDVKGPAALLDLAHAIEHQAEWLRRRDPSYLLTYPSNLGPLARYCHEQGVALPKLREVMTLGEVLDPETRAACRLAWGVGVVDNYSTQESGNLALQCPDHEHYHLQAEEALIEVLDGDRPCGPGEVGRVVATNLHNFAMPLIRNDIGDYGEVGAPCDCGRGLPVLTRIMGRVRNLLTLPSGEQHWPNIGASVIHKVAPIKQLQFIQKDLKHIEVRLVVPRDLTRLEEAKLTAVIHARIGHPFALTYSYPDEIPRGPGGKYEEFRSEVSD